MRRIRAPFSRRQAILREIGIAPLWKLRGIERNRAGAEVIQGEDEEAPEKKEVVEALSAGREAQAVRPTTIFLSAGSRDPVPESLPLKNEERSSLLSAEGLPAEGIESIARLEWDELETEIRQCRRCPLCEQRKQAVPGTGDRNAQWMFVGEGPGAEEDRQGAPFVGQAGRLLDNMLASIGLKRQENVYIANAVKCRPPHNRTPETSEMATCLPYLERQIDLVRPRLLIALGRPAAQALTNREIRIGASRGQIFKYGDIPLVITYHPAYLLRNPQDKAKAWEDLCFARKIMADL